MDEDKNLDTELRCRVCLDVDSLMINIYDEVEDFQSTLGELLVVCGDLTVRQDDGFPSFLCEQCTSELLSAAKFREKCQKTKHLLEHIVTASDEGEDEGTIASSSNEEDKIVKEETYEEYECQEAYDGLDVKFEDYTDEVEEEVTMEVHNSCSTATTIPLTEDLSASDIIVYESTDNCIDEVIADDVQFDGGVEVDQAQQEDIDITELILKPKKQNKEAKKLSASVTRFIPNCKCDICGAAFAQYHHLYRHLTTHKPEQIYSCDKCSYSFTKIDELEKHSNYHTRQAEMDSYETVVQETTPNYNDQEKVFRVPQLTERGDGNKRHACMFCPKDFVSRSALTTHIRVHTGDRPFSCTHCPKTFKSQGGLDLHMKRHNGDRPYKCTFCDKSFVETSNWKMHLRTHTGEKPHECTICGRRFTRVYLLQLHQRTHTGEKPFRCEFCEKSFGQASDLTIHKRIHTGERPHRCHFCCKTFIKSGALNVHMKKHNMSASYFFEKELAEQGDETN